MYGIKKFFNVHFKYKELFLQFLDSADEEYEEEELSYQPVLDFDRFQKFLEEEQEKVQKEEKNGGGRGGGGVSQSVAAKAMEQIMLMAAQSAGWFVFWAG